MKKQLKIAIWLLVLCAACLLVGKCLRLLSSSKSETEEKTLEEQPEKQKTDILSEEQRESLAGFDADGLVVVIDAGHGGFDPGKVGINGAEEKKINLQISLLLEQFLEAAGFQAELTRTTDDGLYQESDSRKKAADMKARIQIIEEKAPIFAVSIHQNSFTQESSCGAQVFYYQTSEDGKKLAETLQTTLKEILADGNHREIKANDSYYLLKNSPCPMVIVECGFLSNAREAELLVSEEYQQKIAWAICSGIVKYCREERKEDM